MTDSTTPQDDAAMPPASTGSGSRLPVDGWMLKWAEAARGMRFMGEPVHELGRDELLAVVGWLTDQVEQERKHHASSVDLLKAVSRVAASR